MRFHPSKPLTVGAEFELQIVDAESLDLSDGILPLMDRIVDDTFIKPEMMQNTIEIATKVCGNVSELDAHLHDLLGRVMVEAERLGLEVCGAGTHPFSLDLAHITPYPRYLKMEQEEGYVVLNQIAFATHVHVGVTDPDEMIRLASELNRYLPVLIAVAANSPFWRGHETRHVSFRQRLLASSQSYGVPPAFSSWNEFDRFFEMLLRARVVNGVRDLHWDIRPRPDFGTVEIRAMDAQQTPGEVAALAALVRCLAAYLQQTPIEDRPDGLPRPMHWWLERENCYQAAHLGLDARYVRNDDGGAVPLREVIELLMDELVPVFRQLGESLYMERLRELMADGCGYTRQMEVYQATGATRNVARFLVNRMKQEWAAGTELEKRAG